MIERRKTFILLVVLSLILLGSAVTGLLLEDRIEPAAKWLFIIGILGFIVLLYLLIAMNRSVGTPMWAQYMYAAFILVAGVFLLIEGVNKHDILSIVLSVLSFALSVVKFIRLLRGDSSMNDSSDE